jgi:hypothetical protein
MTGRREWVQADVRCILCGRIQGKLLGQVPEGAAARTVARLQDHFHWFRAADATAPVALARPGTLRCLTCRGATIVDEIETFTTYEEDIVDEELEPNTVRRGRPPKPWRRAADSRLIELGLAG